MDTPPIGNEKKYKAQKGFTLIEILVALFLVVIILSLVGGNPFSTRANLERNIFDLETALRYARDEASLRNAIVRLRLNFEHPQSYSLEYGPNDNFVIPLDLYTNESAVRSRREDELIDQAQSEIDSRFNRVQAFQGGVRQFHDGVSLIAAATTLSQSLMSENEFAIYVYPSGEMDAGIIILGSDDEVGILTFESFVDDYEIDFIGLDFSRNVENIYDLHFDMAQRLYQEWYR